MTREVRQRAQEEYEQLTARISKLADFLTTTEETADPDVVDLESQLEFMKKYHAILEKRLKKNDKKPEVIVDSDRLKKLQDGSYQIYKELDEAWYRLSIDVANGPGMLQQERIAAYKRIENWKNRLYNLIEESKK